MTLSQKDLRRWRRLEEWQWDAIREMYVRHVVACRKSKVAVDPRFLPEVIDNFLRGMAV